ncbi:hypothetical protein BU17DRAFT_80012 [Hysterangium stoloniferum]|nr:hypothetical protein BU17DRAFT_80012 [Hysterangium stoloniferum]
MEPISKLAWDANESYKDALDQYSNKLQAELKAVKKLITAVEDLSNDKLQDDPADRWCLHADGAFKPTSVIELAETRNEKSSFFNDAGKRERYSASIISKPFGTSEKKYLERAIIKENKRLAALQAQQRGEDAFEAVVKDDKEFVDNVEGLNWATIARDVSSWNNPMVTRTPQECKVRWLGAQHPKFNSEFWNEDEDKGLQVLVAARQQSGTLDWEEIASSLNTHRTPLDCIKRYQSLARVVFHWSSDFDKKLLEAVEKYGTNNWNLVASFVSPTVSGNQCQIRYDRTVNPSIKRGKFTPQEDQLLFKAITLHGTDWLKVSQAVPSRTNVQCRARYLFHSTADFVNAPWDQEDDSVLLQAVAEHGQDWEKVHCKMGEKRTPNHYASRYRILTDPNTVLEAALDSQTLQPIAGPSKRSKAKPRVDSRQTRKSRSSPADPSDTLASQPQIDGQTIDVPTPTAESGAEVALSAKTVTRGHNRKIVDSSDTPPNQILDDGQTAPVSTPASESRQTHDLARNELNPTSNNEDVATNAEKIPRGRKRKIVDISLDNDESENGPPDTTIEDSHKPLPPKSKGRPKPRPRLAAHLRDKDKETADQTADDTSTSSKTRSPKKSTTLEASGDKRKRMENGSQMGRDSPSLERPQKTQRRAAPGVRRGRDPAATHVMSTRSSAKQTNQSNQSAQDSSAG